MPDSNNNKMIGVVLCGGKSSRMGSDKGLLFAGNQRWFERSFELLSRIFYKVVLSVNSNQYLAYREIQPNWEYVVDSVDFARGPLVGIFSVHEKYPDCDIFILACDMIYTTDLVVQNLVSIYTSESEKEFYFYQNEIYLETLCGIYTAKGLRKLGKEIELSSNENFSIHKLVRSFNPYLIEVSQDQRKYFSNYNSPEDFLN